MAFDDTVGVASRPFIEWGSRDGQTIGHQTT